MCVWIWFLNVNIGKVGLNYFGCLLLLLKECLGLSL